MHPKHPLHNGIPADWAVEWGQDPRGVFLGFGVGEVVQRLRWIPPGKFIMGSPSAEAGRLINEGPQHQVELSQGYWLADTPCTQELWQAVMGENPSRFVGPKRPVETVSWGDCHRFLNRLNQLVPGLSARLPSEAEWEYACRAGTTAATWVGDLDLHEGVDGDAPIRDAVAWYRNNSDRETKPVRLKAVNTWGLFDMLGNVHEWCEDWYDEYNAAAVVDPMGPTVGSERVLRGGAWVSSARTVRAACRFVLDPGNRVFDVGFRVARGQDSGL